MNFAQLLIKWYDHHKRSLPWRETNDPYKIWLSEIILQQTRVAQGLPYYEKFVKKFPTVKHLAQAQEKEVLRAWQGLGYYTRARNLQRCARQIVNENQSQFPSTYDLLLKLPGVGPYTAAAIASIAFKEPVAVVDGNVFRVLSRMFGIDVDISTPQARKIFSDKANALISKDSPDIFNQALMEFGATWCTPKNPKCDECIFRKNCVAFQKNMVALLPVKEKKLRIRKRYFYYFVHEYKGKIALKPRGEKDIWHGLYDFDLFETLKSKKPATVLKEKFLVEAHELSFEWAGPVKHILSHQVLHIYFIWVKHEKLDAKQKASYNFYSAREVSRLPKPIVVTRFLTERGFIRQV